MDAEGFIEEGEIVDDDNYTPLERPSTYSSTISQARPLAPALLESEEEVESSSDSDSDSDIKTAKRKKLKLRPQILRKNYHNKYDIWSARAQEDVLLENLINCDVSTVDRSRTVETYPVGPYVRSRQNKRTHRDRYSSDFKISRQSSSDENSVNGTSRIILDVHVTLDSSEDDIARDIANKLYEEKEELIRSIVVIAGKEKALELFKETKRIEEGGGMLIMNQTRRRTPGGVFLFLVRHDNNITREQQLKIFSEERTKSKQSYRAKCKQKFGNLKQKIIAQKSCESNLPELLTRAELCQQQLAKDRIRRESTDRDVKNPPPSPVTDGHNSTDEMENTPKQNAIEETEYLNRNLLNYDDECIDSVDMELF